MTGGQEETESGVTTFTEWRRSGDSVHLTKKKGEDGAPEERDVPCTPETLFTGAATVLFFRLAGADPATFATTDFDTDANGEDVAEPCTIVAEGVGQWNGKPALLFTETTADGTVRAALAFGTRDGDSRATVIIPTTHHDMTFLVGRFGDAWKLVRLPTKGDNEKRFTAGK